MEGFDILYLMKTPFFMGNVAQVPAEAAQCDVNADDMANTTEKNLLLVRALTVMNDIDGLKALVQGLMAGETPQKANVQGFSILIQYFVQQVGARISLFLIVLRWARKSTKRLSTRASSSWSRVPSRWSRTRP